MARQKTRRYNTLQYFRHAPTELYLNHDQQSINKEKEMVIGNSIQKKPPKID